MDLLQALRMSMAELESMPGACAKVSETVHKLVTTEEESDLKMRREHGHKWWRVHTTLTSHGRSCTGARGGG